MKTFYIQAYYTTDSDESEMTPADLASKLRGWGFDAVDVEVDSDG